MELSSELVSELVSFFNSKISSVTCSLSMESLGIKCCRISLGNISLILCIVIHKIQRNTDLKLGIFSDSEILCYLNYVNSRELT